MDYANKEALVSTEWLAAHLAAPDVRVVDASWYLPTAKRDPKAEYEKRHIPGAVFFDIDAISDRASPLPHMLPSPEAFASRMRKMGLGDGNRVILYDGGPPYAAMRVWWTFRAFGHEDVAVLDGGLRKWLKEDRPVASEAPEPRERHFTARVNHALVRGLEDVRRNIASAREQVIDARSAGRFAGSEPEPRPGLRAGHIPGSLNLPFDQLVDAKEGTVKPAAELKRLFTASGVDLKRPIVTSCGSGVTASVLAFALYLIGHKDAAVYDGSWSEWGARSDTPVESGTAAR